MARPVFLCLIERTRLRARPRTFLTKSRPGQLGEGLRERSAFPQPGKVTVYAGQVAGSGSSGVPRWWVPRRSRCPNAMARAVC